eukprot:4784135-Pyramimonas_sp.AAC.1
MFRISATQPSASSKACSKSVWQDFDARSNDVVAVSSSIDCATCLRLASMRALPTGHACMVRASSDAGELACLIKSWIVLLACLTSAVGGLELS